MIPHKILMEISVGKGRTVGGNEEVGTVKIRCVDRHQLYLAGPLGKLAGSADIPRSS